MRRRFSRPTMFGFSLLIGLFFAGLLYASSGGASASALIPSVESYGAPAGLSSWETLVYRVQHYPFHLVTLGLFVGAIIHTFLANKFQRIAHNWEEQHKAEVLKRVEAKDERFRLVEDLEKDVSFGAEIMHFLGEIEIVFGIWVIPLLAAITYTYSWDTAMAYIETRNYTEPLFVVVIMALASTRPIIKLAEGALSTVAAWGNSTPSAWWFSILVIGPLFGSLITEPAAMTISAILLAKHFYVYKPTPRMAYMTIGLLFVNVSVGGVLTHFAAPPVLMVASPWMWDTSFMFFNFGWKAVLGIVANTGIYYMLLKPQFRELNARAQQMDKEHSVSAPVPLWITAVHLVMLGWVVMHSHHPVVFVGTLFLFLGFYQATAPHQTEFSLRPALLVGLFLAGLVIHGGLQGWWISPMLSGLHETVLLNLAVVLTAFNDNAAITYLTTLVPDFNPTMKYAVVAGAVTGGGLTVIANAPNPAGQSLLARYFEDGVNPLRLFFAALPPTVVMIACFLLLDPLMALIWS